MAKSSSTVKTRIFKIVMHTEWGTTTTRIYQSKKTFDCSWKRPFLMYGGARYDSYELKHGKWTHIGRQVLKRD